ncbi:MAG: hypothetical protein JGK29_20805, partial [Microcoleus sp. PH2017_17_BER_D_A]|nr:hypothetical protein [Microcoleus sp. PH2017_17_BER_D_A]
MKTIKSSLIILSSIGLLFLGACGKGDEASDTKITPTPPPAASKPASSAPAADPAAAKGAKGGQVVNAGAYHLEFVPVKEATGTHLDL